MTNYDRMLIGGREEDIAILGSDDQYQFVRNIVMLAGRFMDANDVACASNVAMLTEKLARQAVRQPAGGSRPDPETAWAAIHRHRNVQREDEQLRAVRVDR